MRRRDVFAALGMAAALATVQVTAQTLQRRRLGWLSGGPAGGLEYSPFEVFEQTLRALGWRDGENIVIDRRAANGDFAAIPPLAADLVASHPDVIAATGATEAIALRNASREIPIVFLQVPGDPVSLGLVESLARPGGNATGFVQAPRFLWGKRLSLLTELLGRTPQRVAFIGNPRNINFDSSWTDARDASIQIKADIIRAEASAPEELDEAFRLPDRDALLVQHDFLFVSHRARIAELAATRRLPAVYENRAHVVRGGLLSYGPDLADNYRQSAGYVDRILKGASPGDLPVVQASRFEFVLNLTAAKGLNLAVPPGLLARADEVIE